MNVDEAVLRDPFNAYVERPVANPLNNSIVAAVEEAFVDAIPLATISVVSKRKSIPNDWLMFLYINWSILDN